MQGLVWIGKVIECSQVENSDNLDSVSVVCGKGGKWRGVVKRDEFKVGSMCQVYLQDSILPEVPEFEFMRSKQFRVRMCRFRGAPSEVLITPQVAEGSLGDDVTAQAKVTKHEKPVSPSIGGDILGLFPGFIPKTDELNFQIAEHLVEMLGGKPWYATVKYDGSSGTIYRKNGVLGVCSRNYELKDTPKCLGWQLARKYELVDRMPEGFAIQFEMYGESIQKNPIGVKGQDMAVFNVYDLNKCEYLSFGEAYSFCKHLIIPFVKEVIFGQEFPIAPTPDQLQALADIRYPNGKPAEGIVIRPTTEMRHPQGDRVSFKVINLNYGK